MYNSNKTTAYHVGKLQRKCHVCKKTYSSLSALSAHMMTHTERKRISCPDCGKQVYQKLLKGHRMIHTEGRKQMCSICQKTFSKIGSLREHMKLHNKSVPSKTE